MFDIIDKHSCGFTYQNPHDLTNKISELIDQPLKLKKLKANSYAVYKTKLNGTKIYENFTTYLNNFR